MPFYVDEKYVLNTEEQLKVKFPVSFREKMMKENGGTVETPPDVWDLTPSSIQVIKNESKEQATTLFVKQT